MEYYRTKGDLLESQGKDRADVRWVDRQMAKWMIGHNEDGFYFIMDYYREEIENLKKEKKSEWVNVDMDKYKAYVKQLKEENLDLRRHLMYLWERNDHKNECIDWMVQSYFNKNRQQYDYDGAKEKFYSLIKYKEDPLEWEERKWAIDNWIILS